MAKVFEEKLRAIEPLVEEGLSAKAVAEVLSILEAAPHLSSRSMSPSISASLSSWAIMYFSTAASFLTARGA